MEMIVPHHLNDFTEYANVLLNTALAKNI